MSIIQLIETYKKFYYGRVKNPVMKREEALAMIEQKLKERGIEPQIESFELIGRRAA